jgi:ABC-2 type transport system ATP-binding protein
MIEAKNLKKWYGTNCAVNDVSFDVKKGEVLGFLGPNGAGKSTTMRMITGFLHLDGGSVHIGERSIENDPVAAKSMMGYLPENAPLYGDVSVEGFLGYIAKLRGLDKQESKQAVAEAIATCSLESVRHKTIQTLSKGYRHRTCFAQAILHDPDVLIMDEPTDGLDPNQKYEMRNLIKRMGERKAIIISTHILEEVDAICSRVIVINNGELVADSLPSELRERSKIAGAVTMTIAKQPFEEISQRLKDLTEVDKIVCLDQENGVSRVRAFPADGVDNLAGKLHGAIAQSGWTLTELHTEQGRLDDVFREITSSEEAAK